MKVFEGRNVNKLYLPSLKTILEEGNIISPRGKKTLEIAPALTIIEKPDERVLSCYGRGGNIFFLVSEIIWILAGRGDVEFMDYYIKGLKQFKDEEYSNYHGAYGIRTRKWGQFKNAKNLEFMENTIEVDQLKIVINKLRKDNDTRQAVINLWNPYFDNEFVSNDFPCNIVSMIKIRNNKLNWTQIVRSNDINLGLYPTNVWQWSIIMKVVADSLNIKMGQLRFWSDSLHCYEESNIPAKVDMTSTFDIYDYVPVIEDGLILEQLDVTMKEILKYEERLRNGIFSPRIVIYHSKFWDTMIRMLEVFSLKKYNRLDDALKVIELMPFCDLQMMALEYLYRTEEDKKTISKIITKLGRNKELKDFLMYGGKNERII